MVYALAWRKPDNVAGSSAPAIMVGLFVATGGLLFGYDTGTISGIIAMGAFKNQFSTGGRSKKDGTPDFLAKELALMVSILSAGTFVGAILAAPAGDRLGRRKSLMISIGIFAFGCVLQTIADRIPMMVAGRFFAGVGVGFISVLVPLYQSEMAPKWIRGTLVCAYQLAITTGLFLAAVVNYLTKAIKDPRAYRIPLGLQLVYAAILLLGLFVLPETPRYLIKRNKLDAAATSLSRLRRLDITHPALIEELNEITANHEYELSLGPSTYRDALFGSPHLGRRLFTGCGLQILQQLTGCNFVFYYGTKFFMAKAVKDPFEVALILNVVNVVSNLPGMVLVESLGRRRLLITGAIGMCISHFVVAIVGLKIPVNSPSQSNFTIAFTCAFIFFFAASWGPVTWVVTSEIFPLKVRAKSMSIAVASNWILNFAIGYATPFLFSDGPGARDWGSKIYFAWGVFCLLAIIFVYFMVFETSKISLEQIDEMYERVDHAWHSRTFQPSWSFQEMRDVGVSASGVQLEEVSSNSSNESRQRTGSSTESTATSSATMTEEDKIIAQLGDVNLSY